MCPVALHHPDNIRSTVPTMTLPLLITQLSRTVCHFLDTELNIPQHPVMSQHPPAPCYVPTSPQHPVMSQHPLSTLLCPNIPQHPVMSQHPLSTLLCPNIPQHPVMSQHPLSTLLCPNIPQHPIMSQHPLSTLLCSNYSLIFPNPTILNLFSAFHYCQQESVNSKCKQLTSMPIRFRPSVCLSLILPSLSLKKKFNL